MTSTVSPLELLSDDLDWDRNEFLQNWYQEKFEDEELNQLIAEGYRLDVELEAHKKKIESRVNVLLEEEEYYNNDD